MIIGTENINKLKRSASVFGIIFFGMLMIAPISGLFLDVLLTINIIFAIICVLKTIYIADDKRFEALPSILLVTTLLGFSINLSVVRFILQGKGSTIFLVDTIGKSLVGGNYIIGSAVLAVVILIQFMLIMNVTSTIINESENKKDDFYGALYGAGRFVKGKFIADLIFIFINLFAGMAIAVLMRGEVAMKILPTFISLTIGASICSQLPFAFYLVASNRLVRRLKIQMNN